MIWFLLLIALVGGLLFIRFAPNDAARWHKPVGDADSIDGEGWSARVLPASEGLLSDLNLGMLAVPRTQLIAGSVTDGRLTYVTRSKVIGFPDFTTIEQDGDQIKLYGRLRFGRSDLGVNGKRLDGLLERVKAKRAAD
ncbi:MAG: DUF1499 domain-containing protein [Sulfitobacter sp.]